MSYFFSYVFAISPLSQLLRVHIFLLYTVLRAPFLVFSSLPPTPCLTSSPAILPNCVAPTYVISFVCLMTDNLPGYGSLPLDGINTHIRALSESAVIEIRNTVPQEDRPGPT